MMKKLFAFTVLISLMVPVSAGLELQDVDRFVLLSPTQIRIHSGNPYSIWVNASKYAFLTEYSMFPPNRLYISDSTVQGQFYLVNFAERNVTVPEHIEDVVDRYFKKLPYNVSDEGISDDQWNGRWWDELGDDGNFTLIFPFKLNGSQTVVNLSLRPGSGIKSGLFAIYYEGNATAQMTIKIEQDNFKYYGIRPKAVQLASRNHYKDIVPQMLISATVAVELFNVSANGVLTILLMSNTDIDEYDDYSDYLQGYSLIESVPSHLPNTSNESFYARKLDKNHMQGAFLSQGSKISLLSIL